MKRTVAISLTLVAVRRVLHSCSPRQESRSDDYPCQREF
jgi:hypothetical protein